MILGFKQNFPWQEPTYFREKIWACRGYRDLGAVDGKGNPIPYLFVPGLDQKQSFANYKPKLHTIREDAHDRWKLGRSIQMVYRGPKYSILHHFNKGIPELEECRQLQTIVVKYKGLLPDVKIDGRSLNLHEIDKLAQNDGFEGVNDFFNWFTKDFKGKIIGWTDFKY